MKIAYKMFNNDLTCTLGKGTFQYEPDIWYEESKAKTANCGFHAAENPLDCLSYYTLENSQIWIVLLDGDIDEDEYDSRISATRIKLVKKLDLKTFVTAAIKYVVDHPYYQKNRYILSDEGESNNNPFVIVRGKDPIAKGKNGDIIGLIQEEENTPKIKAINIFVVGEDIEKNIYYDINMNMRKE